ncbi:Archaemetzincin, partial [Bienertia sinuspersici]
MTAIIASVTIIGAILAAVLIFFLRRRIMQRVRKREKAEGIPRKYNFEVSQLELQEPPLYTYDMLRNATN